MPWKEVTSMEAITRFVMLAQSDRFTVTELWEVTRGQPDGVRLWGLGYTEARCPPDFEAMARLVRSESEGGTYHVLLAAWSARSPTGCLGKYRPDVLKMSL